MDNDGPRMASHDDSQQTQNCSEGRQRVGLTPTDGQDAYKRTSARSSRRSRSERTSYLMATGHLDIEETRQLNKREHSSDRVGQMQSVTESAKTTKPSHSGDQSLLDYKPSDAINNHDSIFVHNSFNVNPKKHKFSPKSNNSKSKFRQTYTEVTLPMKTSPAFEYILKDNERRNRRCCLWLLYSTLVTICIAIIIFSCTHLASRYHIF